MKSDAEILTAALTELGCTHLEEYAGAWWYCDLSKSTNNKLRAPDLLTSLDAHFQAGSTVEMLTKGGCGLRLEISSRSVASAFIARHDCGAFHSEKNRDLPRALTLAFLKWRQPQENWE